MKIKLVNYGVANNFGDYIEINRELKKFPRLYKSVLAHELKHTKKPFSIGEFLMEFKNINWDLFLFSIKRPKTWTQALPFYIKNRKLVYDLQLILFYLFAIPLEIFIIKFFFF